MKFLIIFENLISSLVHLKAKSELNMDAAQVLIDEYENYPSSVHCSYYGCFQFVAHKLNLLGHTYKDVADAIQTSKNKPIKLTTHGYPVTLIQRELNKKHNDSGFLARAFKDKINLLKKYRELSDYKNESVDIVKGKAALNMSKEVLELVKTKL